MEYLISIRLLSDLCSASGSTAGRSVDTDVCLDKDGYPYIPAKRLKGVLLQGYLDYVDITGSEDRSESYFGIEDGDNSLMYVGDAVLENKDSLSKEDCLLERTRTRVDTKTGVASDGSLRTFAACPKGLRFSFSLETSMDENTLKNVLSLVTHIGLGRNRGLGHVELNVKSKNDGEHSPIVLDGIADEKEYECRILCRLENNLLLPSENMNLTEEKIPGSTLLGFFAHRYISTYGLENPMEDEDFVSIFTKGSVRFSFGFVSDEEGSDYYPLPQCVQKKKNGGEYRLFLPHKDLKILEKGAKYKALAGRYGSFSEKEVSLQEVYHIFEYHHQRDKEAMGRGQVKDESFFQYDALAKGQYFAFSLTGKGNYLKKLLKGLDVLHIGRSRTSQYGTLKVMNASFKESAEAEAPASPYYLAWVETPLILDSHYPEGQLASPELSLFEEAFNKKCPGFLVNKECHFFETEEVSGFNILWKKRKPVYHALSSGSYFLIENPSSLALPKTLLLGKKTSEGYGKMSLMPLMKLPDTPPSLAFIRKSEAEKPNEGKKSSIAFALESKNLALEDYRNNSWLRNLDHGLLGRMLSTLRDCKNFDTFLAALEEIKDEAKRKAAHEVTELYEGKDKRYYQPYFFTLLTLIKYAQRKEDQE